MDNVQNPGLLKIFDEILVNAVDNKQRCPEMSVIKVSVDRETNTISVYNDGDGIPIAMHSEYNMYIPSLIFGQLLSGTNFDDTTKKGKTTIVNLLMRFYETDSGDILIDGVSIKDMKREEIRDIFGMVLQDTWLSNGTIRENIAFGKNVDLILVMNNGDIVESGNHEELLKLNGVYANLYNSQFVNE